MQIASNGFPSSLLRQSIAERIRYFAAYTMPHPKLVEVGDKLTSKIFYPAGTGIIFVYGPTGVGKSTLLQGVSQKLIAAEQQKMNVDKGYIPIVGMEAITPEYSDFDWKDFYIRALISLEEPMIYKKFSRTDTKSKLRLSLESALRHRHPRAFYVDEAQNFCKVRSGRKLLDQTDCIKSLANLTKTQFVLCGTYELLKLRNLNGQLTRRNAEIHFPRYFVESDEDIQTFQGLLKTFERFLPLTQPPDLLKHWEFCYERSIGCVGIMKDWLTRTLSTVLEREKEGCVSITFKDLERCAWTSQQCKIMLNEAQEEEGRILTEYSSAFLDNRVELETVSSSPVAKQETSKKNYSSVGKPNPQRRSIGE